MEYFTYFRPNEELSDLILSQNHIVIPDSGFYSTLCFFHMETEYESGLISALSKIKFNSFEIETKEFDDFDEDSLVLKLSRPNELLQLHKEIVLAVESYTDSGFDEITKQYFWDNYNPHITISESSSDFDRTSNALFGQRNMISRYHLAKKGYGDWKEIQTFYSRE